MLAGYSINAMGKIETLGAGNVTATSTEANATATSSGGNDVQTTACMDEPRVDTAGKLWLAVYAAGSDAVDFDLWSGDVTVKQGNSVCAQA